MLKCDEGIITGNDDVIEHTADLTVLIGYVYLELEKEYCKEIADILMQKVFKESIAFVEEMRNEFNSN